MTADGLRVEIDYLGHKYRQLENDVDRELAKASANSRALDDLEVRARRLQEQFGVPASADAGPEENATPFPDLTASTSLRDELREQAERNLRERGIDPAALDIDSYLTVPEVQALENRLWDGVSVRADLDRLDVMAAVLAGIVAGAVDLLVYEPPGGIQYLGTAVEFDWDKLEWLSSLRVRGDGWLSRVLQEGVPQLGAAFDKNSISGGSAFALMGLVANSSRAIHSADLESMPGIMHGITRVLSRLAEGHDSFAGWPSLSGLAGVDGSEQAELFALLAAETQSDGLDLRSLLIKSTSVAAAEVILCAYFALREHSDKARRPDRDVRRAGGEKLKDDFRYQAMALITHGMGTAANCGKIALHGTNPLSVNYVQWLRFAHSIIVFAENSYQSPARTLHGDLAACYLAGPAGLPTLNVNDPGFPVFRG